MRMEASYALRRLRRAAGVEVWPRTRVRSMPAAGVAVARLGGRSSCSRGDGEMAAWAMRCVEQAGWRTRFQKWTTLLAAGPRARALRCLRGLDCQHSSHEERACGVDERGRLRASEAAEYPVLFSATVAWVLTWGAAETGAA
ncbi:MAG: hypothetical protein SGPRY_008269, partial [Prymnesium sp.]